MVTWLMAFDEAERHGVVDVGEWRAREQVIYLPVIHGNSSSRQPPPLNIPFSCELTRGLLN